MGNSFEDKFEDKLLKIEKSILDKIEKNLEKNIPDNVSYNNIKKNKDNSISISFGKPQKDKQLSQQKYELKKLKIKSGLKSHFVAYASVHLLLITIWFLTTPGGFPWFIFPLFGWGIGMVSHFVSTFDEYKKLDILYGKGGDNPNNTELEENEEPKKQIKNNSNMGETDESYYEGLEKLNEPYISYVREAKHLSDALWEQISESSKNINKDIIENIKDSLSHYTEKVKYLAKKGQFLENATKYFETNDPEVTKKMIQEQLKKDNLDNAAKEEYTHALKMLDKQIENLVNLRNVSDTIEAKLKTSIINLRTLQLDFLKLQYISDESAATALNSLNKKTEEIDEYIDLLSDSLKDIDNQIL